MTPHRADTIDQGGRPAFLTHPVGGPTAVTDALGGEAPGVSRHAAILAAPEPMKMG